MASLRSRLKFLNPARNRIELACDDLLQLSPALHSTFQSRHGRGTGIDAQTKVVIEGYQSAANSFAREAFRAVNPDVGIASHMHCVAPLVLARQRGIPALVLLREPVSSITSLIARFDRPDFSSELSRYTRFYRQLAGVRDYVLFATFEEATSNFGLVIEQLNRRFGSSFVLYRDNDAELAARVRHVIDSYTETVFGDRAEGRKAMPSQARAAKAEALRTALLAPEFAGRVSRARGLFDTAMEWKQQQIVR